jgi:hypothetical protein
MYERKIFGKEVRTIPKGKQNYLHYCERLHKKVANHPCFDCWATIMRDRFPNAGACRKKNWRKV